ncbi:MAG: hypothetical protein ACKOA9_09870 [Actinomycetota bacterium]
MTREPEIALVLSAESWVDDLHRHCANHGGARVRCLVLDPGLALDEDFDVLVAGERWPALTRPFVAALHARNRRVLVVGDPGRGSDLFSRLGVDGVAASTDAPAAIVAALLALCPDGARDDDLPAEGEAGGERTADPSAGSGRAAVVVVGGPWGAGSTEVAIALAARSVRRGDRAVLVDADPVTPSVAPRLGLPLEPNLCTAVDAVGYGLGRVPGSLFDLGAGWPAVLVGVPSRRAGRALRGGDVAAVAEFLARRYTTVVLDVSAGESAGGAGGDDDVVAAVAARATAVVAVGAASPVGVIRLVDWVDDIRTGAPGVPVHFVLNRAPVVRPRRAELAGELADAVPAAGVTFVPSDPRVEDAAWAAALVGRGPFTRALATVHADVTAAPSGPGGFPVDDLVTGRDDVG